VGIGKVLDYRKSLNSFAQHDRNIQQAKNRIEFVETTLEGVEDLIVDAKNWAVNQASSSTAPLSPGPTIAGGACCGIGSIARRPHGGEPCQAVTV
jgi:hypothetical protein